MKSLLIRIEGYEPEDLKVSQKTFDELLAMFYDRVPVDIMFVDPIRATDFMVRLRTGEQCILSGDHLQAINDIVIAYNKLG